VISCLLDYIFTLLHCQSAVEISSQHEFSKHLFSDVAACYSKILNSDLKPQKLNREYFGIGLKRDSFFGI